MCYHCDYQKEVVERWQALTQVEREDMLLEAMGRYHRWQESKGDIGADEVMEMRTSTPDITLERIAGNGGVALFDLVNQLLPFPGRSNEINVVRNASFEDRYDINFSDSSLVPQSKVVRAYQEDFMYKRHQYLYVVVRSIVSMLVSSSAGRLCRHFLRY